MLSVNKFSDNSTMSVDMFSHFSERHQKVGRTLRLLLNRSDQLEGKHYRSYFICLFMF